MGIKEVFSELFSAFEDYKPNDVFFLQATPEVEKEIQNLEELSPETNDEYLTSILKLKNFIEEWFPDEVEEEEQERLSLLLERASEILYG